MSTFFDLMQKLMPILPIGFSVALFVHYFQSLQKKSEAKDFPKVKGQIVSSEIREVTFNDGDFDHNDIIFELDVLYEYEVNAITYKNDRIAAVFEEGVAWEITDRVILERKRKRYLAMPSIDVYYNPEDPQDSFLELEPLNTGRGFVLLFAILCGLLGAGLLVFS